MKKMKSRLTNVTILTNHYSSRNGTKVDKITIHHMESKVLTILEELMEI